jgi:pre-mRNA-splicing factor SYF1
MEVRLGSFINAIQVLGRATSPLNSNLNIRYNDETKTAQQRLFKSIKLWSFYADLEESLGTVESTKAVYSRIMELKIATPQVIINFASFLEENNYFEESFRAYERGIELFGYPVAFEIWNLYLTKFINRYGGTKLERARDLFEQALENCPKKFCKDIYLFYAKVEEDHGLARHALKIYDRATKAVEKKDLYEMFTIYIAKAASFFGIISTRDIYTKALEVLPDKSARNMAIKFSEMETKLGEVDRARVILAYASQLCDPRIDPQFWQIWHEFETKYGNEDTFKEMLRYCFLMLASNVLFKRNLTRKLGSFRLRFWLLVVSILTLPCIISKMKITILRFLDLLEQLNLNPKWIRPK